MADGIEGVPPSGIEVLAGATLPGRTSRHSKWTIAAIVLAQFGNSAGLVAMVLVSYPITVAALDPDNKAVSLALLMGLGSLVQLVVIPLSGALSDRCTSSFGMRRPFIAIGTVVEFGSMLLMGVAPSIGFLITAGVLHGIGGGIFVGGFYALVPDQVPEEFRGRTMGLITMMSAVAGLVASIVLPIFIGNQFLMFVAPAMLMLATSTIAIIAIRDRVLDSSELSDSTGSIVKRLVESYRFSPREFPDFTWGMGSKATLTIAQALLSTYTVYMFTDNFEVSEGDLPQLVTLYGIVGLVAAIGGASFGSWLSDKLRIRKKLALYMALIVFLGAVIAAFSPTVPVFIIGIAISGMATSAYIPIEGAILIDVLPGEGKKSGKYMGLTQVADRLPRSLGSFIAPVVLAIGALTAIGGYQTVYLVGGVMAVAGAIMVRKIKGST